MGTDVDAVEDHLKSATTSCVKYARKKDMPHRHVGGAMRTTTSTMREVNSSHGADTNWYYDTGATDHITSNLEKLMIRDQYHGKDKIHTTNGEGLHISHIGYPAIQTPNRDLHLKNILHVPNATKNLLSVHKLTIDNDAFL
jgi:hypothetical protein